MLDWLKKLAGVTGSPDNPHDVPVSLQKLIAEDLAPLDALKGGIAQKLLAYVLGGEDDEVLLVLSGLKDAAETLGIVACS